MNIILIIAMKAVVIRRLTRIEYLWYHTFQVLWTVDKESLIHEYCVSVDKQQRKQAHVSMTCVNQNYLSYERRCRFLDDFRM